MEEQEILAMMRGHVARYEAAAQEPPGSPPAPLPSLAPMPPLDLPTIQRLPVPTQVRQSSRLVGQLNPRNPGILNRAVQTFKRLIQRSLSWYTKSFHPFHDTVAQTFEDQSRAINQLQDSSQPLRDAINQLQNSINLLHGSINVLHSQLLDLHPLKAQVLELKKYQQTAIAFQDALQTAEAATQEQQSSYVEIFRGRDPVLDVGCGRGEFLQLLKLNGIEAYGVDSDHIVSDIARRKLLNIVEGDLFQHLRELPERSLGGIFCARVIEYLQADRQPELVALCSSRLKSGGVLVIETINPDSDRPFGRNWQIDPSHLRPIYAEILRSMVDSNGFRDVEIAVLAPRAVSGPADQIGYSGNGRGDTEDVSFPNLITRAPAYAVIAYRL